MFNLGFFFSYGFQWCFICYYCKSHGVLLWLFSSLFEIEIRSAPNWLDLRWDNAEKQFTLSIFLKQIWSKTGTQAADKQCQIGLCVDVHMPVLSTCCSGQVVKISHIALSPCCNQILPKQTALWNVISLLIWCTYFCILVVAINRRYSPD